MDFRIEVRRYDDPEIAPLDAAVQAYYEVLYGGRDTDALDPELFEPPSGLFLLGMLDGVAVATGGYRRISADVAEIKRMFVAESARGLGLARHVLAALEESAAADGVQQMVLNTGNRQHEAIALYASSGYEPVEPFGHYAEYASAHFLGKALSRALPVDSGERSA